VTPLAIALQANRKSRAKLTFRDPELCAGSWLWEGKVDREIMFEVSALLKMFAMLEGPRADVGHGVGFSWDVKGEE